MKNKEKRMQYLLYLLENNFILTICIYYFRIIGIIYQSTLPIRIEYEAWMTINFCAAINIIDNTLYTFQSGDP